MSCHNIMPNIWVCRPPRSVKIAGRRRRRFWCFTCRKRHLHTAMMIPAHGYYEPEFWWKCDGCGEDNRLFPGMEYVYAEEI
jgi:hypothetical protein